MLIISCGMVARYPENVTIDFERSDAIYCYYNMDNGNGGISHGFDYVIGMYNVVRSDTGVSFTFPGGLGNANPTNPVEVYCID